MTTSSCYVVRTPINLLLARSATRRREIATRLALGAGRGRIIRQLLLESALVAGGGMLLGLALAWWGRDLLVAMRALGQEALVLQPRLDLPVLGFAGGVTLLTTILFGLMPAWQATRLDLRTEFSGGTRGPARPGPSLAALQPALPAGATLLSSWVIAAA